MALPTTTPAMSSIEPFVFQATPQTDAKENAQAAELNNQAVEDYLNSLRVAMIEDLEAIYAEVNLQHP